MADDLKKRFETALGDVKDLPSRPGDDDMLSLYALFKQATKGDVEGERPGMFDFVGGAKYDAWTKLQGTSDTQAMQQYIDKVQSLKASGPTRQKGKR